MAVAKVWFITGCSSGFGSEIAFEALRQGDKVIATARNATKLDTLKQAGADIMAYDVTASLPELQKKAEEAVALHGRIDYLVNNAGYVLSGSMEETTPEETQQQFDTNVFGLINTTRVFLPYFRKQRSGVIGNFSSLGGWGGYAGAGNYCGSKWAVSGISESMTYELADFGIKVCSIEPGYFRSRLLNADNRKGGPQQRRVQEYTGTAADQVEKALEATDNQQPGDPKKGAKVIVDVLGGKSGKEVPLRLVLGTDSYEFIKKKCEDTLTLLEEWKDVTRSTDIA